jgi:hypothetical protein
VTITCRRFATSMTKMKMDRTKSRTLFLSEWARFEVADFFVSAPRPFSSPDLTLGIAQAHAAPSTGGEPSLATVAETPPGTLGVAARIKWPPGTQLWLDSLRSPAHP